MVASPISTFQFLLLASLLLIVRGHRHDNTEHDIDNTENNEVGEVDHLQQQTSCRKSFCPKAINYPTNEIIEAVDRFHEYLNTHGIKDLGINGDLFFTSERSRTLYRRPSDHWYFSERLGCKQHASVVFPQEAASNDGQVYYVVNVPNFLQSLVLYTCAKDKQSCPKATVRGLDYQVTRSCNQKLSVKQLVVLPMNKRKFEIKDFQVKWFTVPSSCKCTMSQHADYVNDWEESLLD